MHTNHLIALPLALTAMAGLIAVEPPTVPPKADSSTSVQGVVNKTDPVTGKPVVSTVEPLRVQITNQSQAAQGSPAMTASETVLIGFSDQSSRQQVQQAEGKAKEQFALAARRNGTVKDGQIVGGSHVPGTGSGTSNDPNAKQNPGTEPRSGTAPRNGTEPRSGQDKNPDSSTRPNAGQPQNSTNPRPGVDPSRPEQRPGAEQGQINDPNQPRTPGTPIVPAPPAIAVPYEEPKPGTTQGGGSTP